jgi:hypothetical protein
MLVEVGCRVCLLFLGPLACKAIAGRRLLKDNFISVRLISPDRLRPPPPVARRPPGASGPTWEGRSLPIRSRTRFQAVLHSRWDLSRVPLFCEVPV